MRYPALAALLAVPAVASLSSPAQAARQSPDEQFARLTAGLVPGKPVDCISLSRSYESRTIPRRTIAYRDGATWYVANFSGGCDALDWDTYIVTRTPSDRLCRGDIAQIRENSTQTWRGSCAFDDFTPYTRPPKPRS